MNRRTIFRSLLAAAGTVALRAWSPASLPDFPAPAPGDCPLLLIEEDAILVWNGGQMQWEPMNPQPFRTPRGLDA